MRLAGGYTFLAHPHDRAVPLIGENDYAWRDWDIEGFTGLELWNYMSSFKEVATAWWRLIPAIFWPDRFINGPDPNTLAKWDALLAGHRRVSVLGGSDAHGFIRKIGPFKIVIYPYEQLFRAVNTHLLLDEPPTGQFDQDKPRILAAIGRGRGWVGYDLLHPTRGFRFSAQGQNRGTMGDTILFNERATLQVFLPTKARIEVIFQGELIAEGVDAVTLLTEVERPGAYRVACYLPHKGRERGWIYSNPIYLVQEQTV